MVLSGHTLYKPWLWTYLVSLLHTATICPNSVRCLKLVLSNFICLLLSVNLFGFLTLVSLISKAFQTLLSKHLFPTENLISISGRPEYIIGIPSPVHCITAFPCLLSVPYSPLRALHIVPTLKTKEKTSIQADQKIILPFFKINCWVPADLEPGRQ